MEIDLKLINEFEQLKRVEFDQNWSAAESRLQLNLRIHESTFAQFDDQTKYIATHVLFAHRDWTEL